MKASGEGVVPAALATRYVLPASASRVVEWLEGDAAAKGEVAFVNASTLEPVTAKIRFPPGSAARVVDPALYGTQSEDEVFAKLTAETPAAHTVLFYCDFAGAASPARAAAYQRWQEQAVPEGAWRRVRVLSGGAAALAAFIAEQHPGDLERLLSWWDPDKCVEAREAVTARKRAGVADAAAVPDSGGARRAS